MFFPRETSTKKEEGVGEEGEGDVRIFFCPGKSFPSPFGPKGKG